MIKKCSWLDVQASLERGIPYTYPSPLPLGFASSWELNNEEADLNLKVIMHCLGRRTPAPADQEDNNNNIRTKHTRFTAEARANNPPLLVYHKPVFDDNLLREISIERFFTREFISEDDCDNGPLFWRFPADPRAKVHLTLYEGFYPRELGDFLSFWQNEYRSSSHQYICSTGLVNPNQANKATCLLTEDLAPITRLFPDGATAFIRLMPGNTTQRLRITVIHATDSDMLTVPLGTGASLVWTSLPTSPFVRAWEFVLDNDNQVVCIPPGCLVSIRNADRASLQKIFYLCRFAVFPGVGGIKFVLSSLTDNSEMHKIILWNAAHHFTNWMDRLTQQLKRGHCLTRLIPTCIKFRQCVAFMRNTCPERNWNWGELTKDIDISILQSIEYLKQR